MASTGHASKLLVSAKQWKWVDTAQIPRRIDEGNTDLRGNVTEEVGVENGGNGRGLERENEVDLEAVVMRITGVADQVEKVTDLVDQAVVEALAVVPVVVVGEKVGKIKGIQVHSSQKKRLKQK